MSVNSSGSGQIDTTPNYRAITAVARAMVVWSGMSLSAMGPLLPEIKLLYDVSVVEVSWVYALLILGSGVALSIVPRLSDTVGDRFTMTLTPAMMAVGLALAATGSFAALLLGVFITGMGGVATPIVIAALRRNLPGQSIGRAVSVAIGGVLLGTGFGYFIGGAIEGHLSLREYFVIAAVISSVLAFTVYKVFPRTSAADSGSLGIVSVALLVTWVVAILFAITKGSTWGWIDVRTLGLIAAGIAVAAFWIRREAGLERPAFDVTLFRSDQFRRTMIGSMTLGMGGSAFAVLFPMVAQLKGAGYGPEATLMQTGFVMLPYALVGMVGATISARLVGRWGGLPTAGIGALGHCVGALTVAFFHESVWQLLIGAGIYGIGIGMLNAGLLSSMQSVVHESKSGMGGSALGVAISISGSIAPIIYATILAQKSVPGLPGVPAESQFFLAFIVNASIDIFCAVICFSSLLKVRQRPGPVGAVQRP
jgi:MFS family permease